ncbi:MAG: SRPBCC family protein [Anaerolineales bacterium]|nr:SRPBCC family protein [Anaerolineales bacterium]
MTPTKHRATIVAEPGRSDLIVTREFDAPRELVFKAYTDPALIVKWLGPRNYAMQLDAFEPRSGGHYRYLHVDNETGAVYAFHGVIHEVVPNERIIQTFEFEGMPEGGHVSLESAVFEALPGGRTRVVNRTAFLSVDDRDGMVASGMESGMQDSYDRLDEVLSGK